VFIGIVRQGAFASLLTACAMAGAACGGTGGKAGGPPRGGGDASAPADDGGLGAVAPGHGGDGPTIPSDGVDASVIEADAADVSVIEEDGGDALGPPGDAGAASDGAVQTGMTYADYAKRALTSMIDTYYTNGTWRALPGGAGGNHDWGNASMTYALYFDWLANAEKSAPGLLDALAGTMNTAPAPCATTTNCVPWSDEYLWDAIAGAREHEVSGSATGLSKAKAAFDYVDQAAADVWTAGACPAIRYQRPDRGTGGLKTNETDSNYVKAAILLYQRTGDVTYLDKAKTAYSADRQFYLDAGGSNLYSVYVYDTGGVCTQQQGRYFASVQGNMIYAGLALFKATAAASYLNDALATAHAVDSTLSDPSGIYADLQAENDVVEPLIEAMYALWKEQGQTFARDWIMRSAESSVSTITPTGAYGRFFNGPVSAGTISQWQANGGYALAFAAAAIDPTGVPATGRWSHATTQSSNITTASLPASIRFTGSAIALIGTVGEQCCESGHARVFVDGVETKDTTGIWQNKSSAGQSLPNSVLFAWTWPTSGAHTIQIQPGVTTGKEGASFVHIQSYEVR
jgi:hypothetical protein